MPMQRLGALVRDIEDIVEVATTQASLPDDDLRRLLQFIAQVVHVVEQAFQDVGGVLVELSNIHEGDLADPRRLAELRRNAALVTTRSHYRDATEICSRLKHLGENFQQFVRPTLERLPNADRWWEIFRLIEHREGRIIMLAEESARELEHLLRDLDGGSLREVRAVASGQFMEIRQLMGELHDLRGRILGYSGHRGFLELTTNRQELRKEIRIMVDKRDQSTTHGHRVSVGAGSNVSGNLVVATTIQDSFKTIAASGAEEPLKKQLEQLCVEVQTLLPKIAEDRRADVNQDLSNLVSEATKPEPRRKWYELSAEGLMDAAKSCGALADPLIATVRRILSLLQ